MTEDQSKARQPKRKATPIKHCGSAAREIYGQSAMSELAISNIFRKPYSKLKQR
jgi:hypothetical protein